MRGYTFSTADSRERERFDGSGLDGERGKEREDLCPWKGPKNVPLLPKEGAKDRRGGL